MLNLKTLITLYMIVLPTSTKYTGGTVEFLRMILRMNYDEYYERNNFISREGRLIKVELT